MKTYKKLDQYTIETVDLDKAPKTIYVIADLRKEKTDLENRIKEIDDILKKAK